MRRVPWTIYRYIGREILVTCLFSICALSLLFMIVSGIRAVQEGFALRVIMPWIVGSLGYSLFFTVPVSLLFATTLVYGRVAADREYTAFCAAGMSPIQLYIPILAISVALTSVAFLTIGDVFPEAHYRNRNIASYLIKQLEHLGKGRKRTLPIEGGKVYYEECDGRRLKGIIVKKEITLSEAGIVGDEFSPTANLDGDQEEEKIPVFFKADSAVVSVRSNPERVVLTLDGFKLFLPDRSGGKLFDEHALYEFITMIPTTGPLEVEFPIHAKDRRTGDFTNEQLLTRYGEHREARDLARRDASEATDPQLQDDKTNLASYFQSRMNDELTELWRRRALALSIFTFPLLGFPISVTLRYRHRLVSFFLGTIVVFLFFYPLLMLGTTLGEMGALPPSMALLSGNIAIVTVASFLLGRLFHR